MGKRSKSRSAKSKSSKIAAKEVEEAIERCCLCKQLKSAAAQGRLGAPPFRRIILSNDNKSEAAAEFKIKIKMGTQLVDLPADLISNILSRLPIKSLLQCRLVFKEWNRLTRIPQFIKLNLHPLTFAFPSFKLRLGLNDFFIFGKDLEETIRIPFIPELQGMSYMVTQSCNGFLLLQPHYLRQQNPPHFIIYNPITKETIVDIPKRPPDSLFDQVCFVFNAQTQKYKLVIGFRYIITVGENSFRKLPDLCIQNDLDRFQDSVSFNGSLYWGRSYNDVIVSLDICTEKYRIIGCPVQGPPIERRDNCYLVEFHNKLVFIKFDLYPQEMQIWSLLDDGQKGNWIYESRYTMNDFFSNYYCDQHMYDIQQPVGNDSLLLYHLYDYSDIEGDVWWWRAFIYTPKSGGHVINFITNYMESWSDFKVLSFIPNLASFYNSNS